MAVLMYSCLLFVACHFIDMNITFHLTTCSKAFFSRIIEKEWMNKVDFEESYRNLTKKVRKLGVQLKIIPQRSLECNHLSALKELRFTSKVAKLSLNCDH